MSWQAYDAYATGLIAARDAEGGRMSKTGFAVVPVAMLGESLVAVRAAMQDAYDRGFQVCCEQVHTECCGNPVIEWTPADTAIMDGLHPAEQKLAAMLNARPALPDELSEEAAKAICETAGYDLWHQLAEGKDHYRNMARAAARVFNGGNE